MYLKSDLFSTENFKKEFENCFILQMKCWGTINPEMKIYSLPFSHKILNHKNMGKNPEVNIRLFILLVSPTQLWNRDHLISRHTDEKTESQRMTRDCEGRVYILC